LAIYTPQATGSTRHLCPPKSTQKQPKQVSQKKSTNVQLAKIIRQQAATLHDRVQHNPALKWTWGTDLDEQDIWQSMCGANQGNCLPHSGYDASLAWGRQGGQNSDSPSFPQTMGSIIYSKVSILPFPELDASEAHLREFPLHHPNTHV